MSSLWSLVSEQHRKVYEEKHANWDGKKPELVPVIDISRAVRHAQPQQQLSCSDV